jgi:hypothetical protein
MIAIFDQYGTTLSFVSEPLIKGSVNQNSFTAGFQGKTWLLYPQATITFKRSDGVISPELLMEQYSFVNNSVTYEGYKFDLYDAWFLGVAGSLEITIKLYSGLLIAAQGKVTTSVQQSVLADYSEITPEQYEQIVQQLALKTYDVDQIVFNEAFEPETFESGMLYFDTEAEHKTLTYYHTYENGQSLPIQINQNLHGIGKNNEGEIIYNGMVCYFKDVQGHHILMGKANGNYLTPQKNAMIGVAGTQTANNEYGPVFIFGYLHGIDLNIVLESGTDMNALTFGTKLYLSSVENGKYSIVEPNRPNADIWVATLIDFNTNQFNNATIFIYPQKQRLDGGIDIQLSETQPIGQIEGDLWYDID